MSSIHTSHCRRRKELVRAPDGVSIACELMGEGRPIALLHGFSDSRQSWHETGYVERLLGQGRQVVLIDSRGHGDSGKPREPMAYQAHRRAADVVAVLDSAGIRRADIMGYSMGGLIALAVAGLHPGRVGALIVNSAHPFAQDLGPIRAAIAGGIQLWLAQVEALGGRLSEQARMRLLANDLCALRACVATDRPDSLAALSAVRAPILAIAGSLDPECQAVRKLAVATAGEFLSLEGRNHITAFLAAKEIAAAADAFLGRSAQAVRSSAHAAAN
jgi:pimeloyl-ACP methyl ester carboxylesterase